MTRTKKRQSSQTEMNRIFDVMEKLLHWAAIIDSSDDAIISNSMDGLITSWNRGAEKLYGYKAEEIIGQPISVLMPSDKKDDFPKIMNQLLKGKSVEHYETRRMTKSGQIIDVSITVSPIRDSTGNIVGASKIARDISDRVENDKRKEEFVSTASHELKTPITSQKVFGELLEHMIEKNGHHQYMPYIKKVNQQTDKLTKLIEDLLIISRIRLGRLNMEVKKMNFDQLVEETVNNERQILKHKILLKGKTDKEIPADRDRIGQVLTNLLSNATKYSPDSDKVIVSVKTEGNNVVTSVRDFGIGIEPEYHQKIFEQFFRVNGDEEKTFPGMGIGLHFSREIISRHGGKIWVESEKNKGSTFYFSLPLGN